MPDLDGARTWAAATTTDMPAPATAPAEVIERGHLCGVPLDLGHPAANSERRIVVSSGGWGVGYDGSVDAWTAR